MIGRRKLVRVMVSSIGAFICVVFYVLVKSQKRY